MSYEEAEVEKVMSNLSVNLKGIVCSVLASFLQVQMLLIFMADLGIGSDFYFYVFH